jgi:hypothetical protein
VQTERVEEAGELAPIGRENQGLAGEVEIVVLGDGGFAGLAA